MAADSMGLDDLRLAGTQQFPNEGPEDANGVFLESQWPIIMGYFL